MANSHLMPQGGIPLVSVLIPAWNVAPWLAECLDSVLAQSLENFECIVVDDGSTDNTAQVTKSFADPRIRIIRQENAGVSAARNRALDEARGEFIAFLDGDDLWEVCFLEKMTRILEKNPEVDLAFCHTALFMDSSNRVKRQPWTNVHATGNIWWDMLMNPVFCMGAWVARAQAAPPDIRFSVGMPIAEDRDFLLRLLAHIYTQRNHNAVGLPETLHWYRQRPGSGTRQVDIALREEWPLMTAHLEHPGVPEKTRRLGFSNLAFKMSVMAAFGKKNFHLALIWYARAFRLAPLNLNLYWLPLRKLVFSLLPAKPLRGLAFPLTRRAAAPPLPDNPAVTLIMATLGRTACLPRLLDSFAGQKHQNFEIIIVDQNLPGVLDDIVSAYQTKLRLTRIFSQPGLSRARNAGLAVARGDIIAFPDDDCQYLPNTLACAVKALASVDVVVGRQISDNQSICEAGEKKEEGTGKECALCADDGLQIKIETYRTAMLRNAPSITLFFRKEVVAVVGGFDESLGLGAGTLWGSGEDSDYLIRAFDAGFVVGRTPALKARHPDVDISLPEAAGKAHAYAAGRMHLLRKHRFPLWFKLANVLYPLAVLPKEWLKHGHGAARYRWAMFTGRLYGLFQSAERHK